MSSMDNLMKAFAVNQWQIEYIWLLVRKQKKKIFLQVPDYLELQPYTETVHVHNHLKAMDGINSTTENLKTAIKGEIKEFKEMYHEFIEVAKKEKNNTAI